MKIKSNELLTGQPEASHKIKTTDMKLKQLILAGLAGLPVYLPGLGRR